MVVCSVTISGLGGLYLQRCHHHAFVLDKRHSQEHRNFKLAFIPTSFGLVLLPQQAWSCSHLHPHPSKHGLVYTLLFLPLHPTVVISFQPPTYYTTMRNYSLAPLIIFVMLALANGAAIPRRYNHVPRGMRLSRFERDTGREYVPPGHGAHAYVGRNTTPAAQGESDSAESVARRTMQRVHPRQFRPLPMESS